MKKILITGANSYIGTSFENYIKTNYPGEYEVDTIDMVDGSWREKSFAGYDSVFHVAGIAHQKETKKNAHLYYKVNRDLAIETAQKVKNEGVKQFIFLSSMSVYGIETGVITKGTIPNPKSHYGKSKLQAEEGIMILKDDNFKVCILRPPMVYGAGCKGNYQSLYKWANKLPIFPDIENKRSMIEIGLLCKYIGELIEKMATGTYFPQNKKYNCTTKMVREIALSNNHTIIFTKIFNPVIRVLKHRIISKLFGDLIYKDME